MFKHLKMFKALKRLQNLELFAKQTNVEKLVRTLLYSKFQKFSLFVTSIRMKSVSSLKSFNVFSANHFANIWKTLRVIFQSKTKK